MGEKYKHEDEANRARVEAKNGLENYVYNMKNTANDEKIKEKIESNDKEAIEAKCSDVINWLDNNQSAEKEEYEEKQAELEQLCSPIMKKLHAQQGQGQQPAGEEPTRGLLPLSLLCVQ